ncbi:Cysteine-rich secretory protein family protein [Nannocystis exedens]|uniref:Cysteine-rich secretory protein family protein n=1 Tax=Nannocystis exedens TaxID=54 RepID=A0A1I2J421_9BACT|nr:CAP domain-containing protein [Nannocystis exedens]PCC72400.1 Cysteine-rich secretory protein family protein [Nannocystis exedens]SFF48750.1 Cysteine-rich secretory protein family protein [Nannocystis exedens]
MSTAITPHPPCVARPAAGLLVAGLLALAAACRPDMSLETYNDVSAIDVTLVPRSDPEPGRLAGITAAHNVVRGELGIDPLTWSSQVAGFAQEWADKLAQKGCVMEHRPSDGPDAQQYGENIFGSRGYASSATHVIANWVSEVQDYDAITHTCSDVCGHYTQVVWADSKRLGCGVASCGDREVWVCNYDPPGNILGERPYEAR